MKRAPAIEADSVLMARTGLAGVEIDGEMVLYDDADRRMHWLNSSAATLWKCIDGTGRLSDIAADIAEVYGIDTADVLADLLPLARQLADEGLVAGFRPGRDEAGRLTVPEVDS